MFVFFTIPWIFVISLVVIGLGIGVSVLQFVLDHIIIISVILWLPVAWFVWAQWKDKAISDEEKAETVLFPIFLIPPYAALIRLVITVLNALNHDLFAFFLYLLAAPVEFGIFLAVSMGVSAGLQWLNEKFIKSKNVTICLGAFIAALMTYILWSLNWG